MHELPTARETTQLPPAEAERLAQEPTLGGGNFLDRALEHNSHPTEAFLFAQRPGGWSHSEVTSFSLQGLHEVRTRLAAWYHQVEIDCGDLVGVYLGEGVDPFLHYLALTSLGAIPVLVDGDMPGPLAAEYFARVGVVGMVADPVQLEALQHGSPPLPGLRFTALPSTVMALAPATAGLPAVYPYQHADHDTVLLCHSSTTTRAPRPLSFVHRRFFLDMRHRLLDFANTADERMLSALPQWHSTAIGYLMTATLLGLPVLVTAGTERAVVYAAMHEFRPTIVVAFPQTLAELTEAEVDPTATSTVHTWINPEDVADETHIRALSATGNVPPPHAHRRRFSRDPRVAATRERTRAGP